MTITEATYVTPSYHNNISPSSGEQHFILGEYAESVQVWRAELLAEREKGQSLFLFQLTWSC